MYRSRKVQQRYDSDKKKSVPSAGDSPCPFCKLAANEKVIRNGPTMYVLENMYGYAIWELMDVEEHLMIVPKRHATSIAEFTKPEKAELIELIADYESKGYNVYARGRGNVIKSRSHQHTHLLRTKNRRAKFFIFLQKPYFIRKV